MDTMSALRIMPAKADECKRFSANLIEGVNNGQYNPLEILVILRALESVSEAVREAIKPNIMTEVGKYSERTFEAFGAKLEKSEVGVVYDYPATGDREWAKFHASAESAISRRKEREAFLRALKEPMTLLDEETGEVYQVRPPTRKSNSGIKVFL